MDSIRKEKVIISIVAIGLLTNAREEVREEMVTTIAVDKTTLEKEMTSLQESLVDVSRIVETITLVVTLMKEQKLTIESYTGT